MVGVTTARVARATGDGYRIAVAGAAGGEPPGTEQLINTLMQQVNKMRLYIDHSP